ncbi:MAG: RNase adapter RapZ [Gammaproteobacteria bacterium]|jgi:RNase adapter protein RapZ|nr:RNase adapter RapZ [Gammaproteobacteria bacterium]MBT7308618.1 RNase adapter RapZ [Gammaproteobacteria bacterium]
MFLFVISGLSGAGKSVALHAIEDQGGYCIDNLPIELLSTFTTETLPTLQGKFTHIGLSIDARNRSKNLQQLPELLNQLNQNSSELQCKLIFIEADLKTITRRFGESRRPHPLKRDYPALDEAILREIEQMAPIAAAAHFRLDSSQTTIYQLRAQIQGITGQDQPPLFLKLQSFGFKQGAPRDADFLFDARCLPNPHWNPELRQLTGQNREVVTFLEQTQQGPEMAADIEHYLTRWIPHFLSSERCYLTIAIGCTGGQHRSVYLVEKIAAALLNLQEQSEDNGENSWIQRCKINIHHRQLKGDKPQ